MPAIAADPIEIDEHPRLGWAWTVLAALSSVGAAVLLMTMLRDPAPIWFFVATAGIAILTGCAALRRFGVGYPYWLFVSVVFVIFTGAAADQQGTSAFSPGFERTSFFLIAAATLIVTLGLAAGQWQVSRSVRKALAVGGRYEISIPRYPLAALCIALLLAEPAFALDMMGDGDPRAYVFLAMMPFLALAGLWRLRERPTSTIVDAEGIENTAQLPHKIYWRDLVNARIVTTSILFRERQLQFLFKDARSVPKGYRDPAVADEVNPPNAFMVGAVYFWIPPRLLATLIRDRIARHGDGASTAIS